jgi:hypothetical protein
MQEKYDGGPAFPAMHFDLADNEHGMTLRDYFAAAAMQGLLSRVGHDKINAHDVLAQRTYQIADAMLEAREQE